MALIAAVSALHQVQWQSCRSIGADLLRAYSGIEGVSPFFLEGNSPSELLKSAREVHDAQPTAIGYLDHAPHAALFLAALAEVYGERTIPPVYVHVYGDFSLGLAGWRSSEDWLKKFRIQWISASHRHARMLGKLLKHPHESVEVCPFPVDCGHFQANEDVRREQRAKFGIGEGEWLAVYGGRISLQKNVEPLLDIWRTFQRESPAKLIIAGTFDDLGAPITGIREPLNGSFHRFQEALRESGAIYAGALTREEMAGLYAAADAYLSLSLHHDEDFGLAPAEALCSGVPVLLSDWGGYSGFVSEVPGDCRLIPVKLNPAMGLRIDRARAFSSFIQMANVENSATRVERARRYAARFSTEAVRESLKTILKRNPPLFTGFSTMAGGIAERMQQETPFSRALEERRIYEYLYANYLS